MNLTKLIHQVKSHPDFEKAGMVLVHNGVVRASSRDGRPVTGLKVHVDHEKLETILENARQDPGIVDVVVEIAEDRKLNIGDDVMVLVVAGDIREHVLQTLSATLNAIKATVTSKTEFYA